MTVSAESTESDADSLVLCCVNQAVVHPFRWIPLQHQIHVVGGQVDFFGSPKES